MRAFIVASAPEISTRARRFAFRQRPVAHFRTQFAGDAYLNEMGITNPQFPDEMG